MTAANLVSVITRKGQDQADPAIYFLHGGGMVMGNRFAGAAPLFDWRSNMTRSV